MFFPKVALVSAQRTPAGQRGEERVWDSARRPAPAGWQASITTPNKNQAENKPELNKIGIYSHLPFEFPLSLDNNSQ